MFNFRVIEALFNQTQVNEDFRILLRWLSFIRIIWKVNDFWSESDEKVLRGTGLEIAQIRNFGQCWSWNRFLINFYIKIIFQSTNFNANDHKNKFCNWNIFFQVHISNGWLNQSLLQIIKRSKHISKHLQFNSKIT